MTETEKDKIAKNLDAFVQSHQKRVSPYHKYFPLVQSLVAIGIISIVSIPLVFNQKIKKTVPGEVFYPVKIIQEKVERASIQNTEKKVALAIKRTDARIKEAVQLNKEKSLTKEKQEQISVAIDKEISTIKDSLEKIKATDPEKALPLNSELAITLKDSQAELEKSIQNTESLTENSTKTLPLVVEGIKKNLNEVEQEGKEIEEHLHNKLNPEEQKESEQGKENETAEKDTPESVSEKEMNSLALVLEAETELVKLMKEQKTKDSLMLIDQIQKLKADKKFSEAFILIQDELLRLKNEQEKQIQKEQDSIKTEQDKEESGEQDNKEVKEEQETTPVETEKNTETLNKEQTSVQNEAHAKEQEQEKERQE